MKLLMGTLLGLALATMLLCMFATHFKKHNLKHLIQIILGIAILIIFNYEVVLFLMNEQGNLFAHSIYFVASDWMLYYMLQFSIEYSGGKFTQFVKKNLMILLLLADSVSLLLNTVFQHLFSLYSVTLTHGEHFFAMDTKPVFYIHYFIIIMLVTLCLISLFYRAFHTPRFYRSKYLTIAVIMVIIVAANIITFKQAIDYSIVGYAIEGIALYYCVFVFTPQRLLQKTLLLVSQDMPIGLIVFDLDGEVLYNNSFAGRLLDTASPLLDDHDRFLIEWCKERYFSNKDIFSEDASFTRNSEKMILNVRFQPLADIHNKLQGGYFVIYDRT